MGFYSDSMGYEWDIPSGKLTVGPWKSPIVTGNWSSNPYLPVSMLIDWRGLKHTKSI